MTMIRTADTTAPAPQHLQHWRSYAACVVVVGLLFLGRAAWDITDAVQFASHGVATEARLVGITHVPEGRGRMGHYARVRYVAFGKPIIVATESRILPAEHKIGDLLRVAYLSTDPERVRLADDAGSLSGWTWLMLGLGIAVSLAGSIWLLRLRRRQQV